MDDKTRTVAQPVVSPGDAWHLALAQGYEQVGSMMDSLIDELGPMKLDEFVTRIRERLSERAELAWTSFFRGVPKEQAVSGDVGLVRVEFDPDRALPIIHVPSTDVGISGWGVVDMPTSKGGREIVLATPFREVALSSLPEGTQLIKLQDARHAATAALVDVLSAALRDSASVFATVNPRSAWHELNRLIHVYRQAARYSISVLSEDDYVNWKPSVPSEIEIGGAPEMICQIAATARGQSVLAVHLVAHWLQALADTVNKRPASDRQALYIQAVESARNSLSQILEGMNRACLAANAVSPSAVDAMVIIRPHPIGIPVLAAVPRAEQSSVRPLRAKKASGAGKRGR
jgi:hypothetical protein